ncbi:MAG TPA: hypothetical protein VL173_03355 [Vicinamibacterales bacterium]|nr:hypothetical protein [Vicinamibacterales bacterium]
MPGSIRLSQLTVVRAIVLRTRNALLVCALSVIACACGSHPGEPAPRHPAEGTWSGSVTDEVAGAGSMRVVLQYLSAQQTISGSFTMTFAGATVSGALLGPALAGDLSETMTCGARSALGFMTLTPAGSRMQGHYVVLNDSCSPINSGDLDLTKQP